MKQGVLSIAIAACMILRAGGQDVQLIDREGIESLSWKSTDTTYVINFWATWCSPCVKEIEYFEALHASRGDTKLKVVLVSLDFPNQMERRLVPFLEQKEISAPVRLMTDLDYNAWIERVDSSWTGAIPATLIYNRDRRVFLEQELTHEQLVTHVSQIMN